MKKLRNICIIAHVDHGKTTLLDHLLRQAGTFHSRQEMPERIMDNQDLEREKGITISAKNTSILYNDFKINIVDTPGHADFGGEVERVLDMVDGAILLVDAVEGPLPQTRFVLEKALKKGLKLILVINKVDRKECIGNDRIQAVIDQTFDLFIDLGASDQQASFTTIYACAKYGWGTKNIEDISSLLQGDSKSNFKSLLDTIIEDIPAPQTPDYNGVQILVSNISYSEYVGRMAIGRLNSGQLSKGQSLIQVGKKDDQISQKTFEVSNLYVFDGLRQTEVKEAFAGDIVLIAGCSGIEIGDSIISDESIPPLPRIEVEKPTLAMIFSINTSPLSGKEGEAIQSRKLQEILLSEVRKNVALKFETTEYPDQFRLLGRGELQFAIIIEQMRRKGLEFMVGKPLVIYQTDQNGKKLEPIERAVLNLPEEYTGDVTNMFQERKGILTKYNPIEQYNSNMKRWINLEFEIPSRGLLGIRSQYLNVTKGEGLFSSEFLKYDLFKGSLPHRNIGSLISDRAGKIVEYALFNLEDLGNLFVSPGQETYEGMIIGEGKRENDLNVNPLREKKLTNVRAAGSDELIQLKSINKMSLERCIEWIDEDEWIEVTPQNIRLRKKILAKNKRSVRREDRIL